MTPVGELTEESNQVSQVRSCLIVFVHCCSQHRGNKLKHPLRESSLKSFCDARNHPAVPTDRKRFDSSDVNRKMKNRTRLHDLHQRLRIIRSFNYSIYPKKKLMRISSVCFSVFAKNQKETFVFSSCAQKKMK